MDLFNVFSDVIGSVLASTPPDAGSPEAAMAGVAGSAQQGPKPPLLGAEQRAFVQTHVLPALLVIVAKREMTRRVAVQSPDAGTIDYAYYEPDKSTGKQVGVEVLASRYYRDNDFPEMQIRTYGATGGPYYHCAELVWNSAILTGFHVPMNKNPNVPGYFGFYNSANVLYDQCSRAIGVAELATPTPEDSFKAATVFKGDKGSAVGLAGPRRGDLMVARRDANDAGERNPGHIALLADVGTSPPTFVEAGVSVRDTAHYALAERGIDGHDARLVRLRTPDWTRIERWLAEGEKATEFSRYFKAGYPEGLKQKSYLGLFGLAVAQLGSTLAADTTPSGKEAQAQWGRLREALGLKDE